jgi:ubiquinone/menaquinone biosynthesis C-methylase UbiE
MRRLDPQHRDPRGMRPHGSAFPACDQMSTCKGRSLAIIAPWRSLRTTIVRNHEDIRQFFDACAPCYAETHGSPARLLQQRLALIRQHACLQLTDAVLEIGCGHGSHLLGLADAFGYGLGIDLSPAMVQVAHQRSAISLWRAKLHFRVDQGEHLHSVADASMDVIFCVGALEHVLDKARMLAMVFRVLRPGGRFVCLTPNGHYLWYRWLAPWLGLETRHLSTDHFLSRHELEQLLSEAGLRILSLDYWTFIPRGNIPAPHGALLHGLDRLGTMVASDLLRGGLVVCAEPRKSRRTTLRTPQRISTASSSNNFWEHTHETNSDSRPPR